MEWREQPQKNPLPAHPSPIISPTANHAGTGHGKPFRGPLSGPAFSRGRLICSYFNRLLPREQGREEKKKRRMNRQRYWKGSWLVTLTLRPGPCQTPQHSLTDLRTGVSPTAEHQQPQGACTALLSHTLQWERPVWAGLVQSTLADAKWICFMLCVATRIIIPEFSWCGNPGSIASCPPEMVTWVGSPSFPPGSLWRPQEGGTYVGYQPCSSRIWLQQWALLIQNWK